MNRKIETLIIVIMLLTVGLYSQDIIISDKNIDIKEDIIEFSLSVDVARSYEIKDINNDIKVGISTPGFKIIDIDNQKIKYNEINSIFIKGKAKAIGEKALESNSLKLIIDYHLCGENSSICLVSSSLSVILPFDTSKLTVNSFSFSPFSLLILFASGIATSFTPCVFPLIPIVFGFIGATGKNTKKAIYLSSIMVVSMGVIFSALGIFAALSGKVFGSITNSPVFLILAGVIIALMGFSLMGYLPLKTPKFISQRINNFKGKGFFSAVIMGLFIGAIGIPCVGPVLVSVLTYVSTTQNALQGGLMLFSYSLGIGIIFILAGTLSQSLGKTVKQGKWMEKLKDIFSIMIIGGGVYFISKGLNSNLIIYIYLLFTGFYFMKQAFKIKNNPLKIATLVIAIALLVFPSYKLYNIIYVKSFDISMSKIEWENNYQKAAKKARKDEKLLFIDFYADWCENCHKMEREMEKIYPRLKNDFIMLKINMDKDNKYKKILVKKYNIIGLPGIVIECPDGPKLEKFHGYKSRPAILETINKSLGKKCRVCGCEKNQKI